MDYGITVCRVFSLKMHNILKKFNTNYSEHFEVTGNFDLETIFVKKKATKV